MEDKNRNSQRKIPNAVIRSLLSVVGNRLIGNQLISQTNRKPVNQKSKTDNRKQITGLVSNFSKVTKRLSYYFRLWITMSKNSFLVMLAQKKIFFFFLSGKVLRFALFAGFLYFLVIGTESLAGYSVEQTLFFFLTFNLIDILSQFFYREVYRFRPLVVSGDFDLILTKPYNALFRSLMGGTDAIDLITLPPLIFAIVYFGFLLEPSSLSVFLYLLLIINGFLIATAFHIAVLALGIITLEIDHTIMLYRDIVNLGRLPVDIYREPVRSLLTFVLPVGVMISLPAQAFMGFISLPVALLSLAAGFVLIFLSWRFWLYALTCYTSASS